MSFQTLFSKRNFEKAKQKASHPQAEFSAFEKMAFPDQKDEKWKFSKISEGDFEGLAEFAAAFRPEVKAENAQASFEQTEIAWNAADKVEAAIKAFANSFMRIKVEKGAKAKAHAKFSPQASAACVTVVEIGKDAKLDYSEEFVSGNEKIFFGCKAVFVLDEGATLNYYPVQNFGDETLSVIAREFRIGKNAVANMVQAEIGGKFSRVKVEQHFNGDGSHAGTHKTVFFGTKDQHFDITTDALHHGRQTKSDIVVKGALRDTSSTVYRGLIKIDKDAKGTDSFLQDRVLHLSKGVKSNSIPSLVIDNNDVKASHGATTSRLSDQMLFYLRSRGLSRELAQKIMVEGFLDGIVQGIPDEEARRKISGLLERKISAK
ncbi:MAG: SufD family Fe-S cluster assembly protein [Candidatus Diapherotrites archaeon]|nr:SufD family Fe-S cluster assembly protein [Candidatus Diapherotrites archaeon]